MNMNECSVLTLSESEFPFALNQQTFLRESVTL